MMHTLVCTLGGLCLPLREQPHKCCVKNSNNVKGLLCTKLHAVKSFHHHCSSLLNLYNQFFQHQHRIRNKRGLTFHSQMLILASDCTKKKENKKVFSLIASALKGFSRKNNLLCDCKCLSYYLFKFIMQSCLDRHCISSDCLILLLVHSTSAVSSKLQSLGKRLQECLAQRM